MKNLLNVVDYQLQEVTSYVVDEDELRFVLNNRNSHFYKNLGLKDGMTKDALSIMISTRAGRLEFLEQYFKISDFKGACISKIISLKITDLDS